MLKAAMAGATDIKTKRLAFIGGGSHVSLEFGDVEVSVHLFHAFVELGEYLLHLVGWHCRLRNGGSGICMFFHFVFSNLEHLWRSRDLLVGRDVGRQASRG